MTRNYNDYWSSLTISHGDHPGNRFRYKLIAGELAERGLQPRTVLDCGCGDGSLLSVIAPRIPCAGLHGIDIADNVPLQRAGLPIQFRAQDLGRPVPKQMRGVYDLVLCSEVIEHVDNDEMVLRNLADLTAPDGTVVLTTQTGKIYKTEEFLGHIRHYSRRDLCARVEQAGLKVQKSYVAGWPWLNAQKITAHYLQDTIQKNVVQATTLSLKMRALFAVLSRLYPLSSRRLGPQIVIVANKPVDTDRSLTGPIGRSLPEDLAWRGFNDGVLGGPDIRKSSSDVKTRPTYRLKYKAVLWIAAILPALLLLRKRRELPSERTFPKRVLYPGHPVKHAFGKVGEVSGLDNF